MNRDLVVAWPKMVHDLVLLSPEKTILSLRLAGFGSRVMAHLLDLLLIGFLLLLLSLFAFLLTLRAPEMGQIAFALLQWTSIFGPFAYFILFEGLWNGQTLGKKAMSLRVRMSDGTAVTFTAALGRNLLRPADLFPGTYFFGLVAMFTNPKSQRLGDLVANTVVVHEPRAVPRFTPAPHVLGEHPMERYVGDLPGMTREEYVALRRFCDRYVQLSPPAQQRYLHEVWIPLAHKLGIPHRPDVPAIYLAEAVVTKYGRERGQM